jgi:hypothetical protein
MFIFLRMKHVNALIHYSILLERSNQDGCDGRIM